MKENEIRTVAQKMGIKENNKTIFINSPENIIDILNAPKLKIENNLKSGCFDYIHFFAKSQNELNEIFKNLKDNLDISGMLWVSWPKNKQLNTDLTLPIVIKIGYSFGLVESTCLSINEVWSALKFTHPKKNKIYKNSHAELKSRTTNR